MSLRGEHRGVAYVIAPRTPCPGIGWTISYTDLLGRASEQTSAGAFYDGCDDHPEGAYAWAESSVHKFIDATFDDQAAWPWNTP